MQPVFQPTPAMMIVVLTLVLGLGSAILGSWVLAVIRWSQGDRLLPGTPRPLVPWGAASLMAVVLVYLLLMLVSGLGYGVVFRILHGKQPGPLPMRDMLLLSGLSNIGMILLAPFLLKMTSGARLSDLGLTSRSLGKNLLRGAWFCFLSMPLVYGVSILASLTTERDKHPVEQMIMGGGDRSVIVIAALVAVVAAPICEEMLFRGVLLGWFWKVGMTPKDRDFDSDFDFGMSETQGMLPFLEPDGEEFRISPVSEPKDPFVGRGPHDLLANVAASVIFAGMHAAVWPTPIPLFFLSLALGEVYRRTGSLYAPIALHMTFNGLSTFAMILVSQMAKP